MSRHGRAPLLLAVALLLASCQQDLPAEAPTAEVLLARACRYLWSQQAGDGGWHSETHGFLRGGQAWTPFILQALLAVPDSVYRQPTVQAERALAFIRRHTSEAGVLGLADPNVLEYPNYATAYALRVLVRHGTPADGPLVEKMKRYLLAQQLVEARSLSPDDPAYGGWGFGEANLPPGQPGHADLSHTRRILQALRDAGHLDPVPYVRAQAFLRLVQKHPADPRLQPAGAARAPAPYDGGFYYSPVVLVANKGGQEEQGAFRSYATATCDGVLALLAAGMTPADEPVVQALRWLRAHARLDRPEGIPEGGAGQWERVLFYYHLAARAEAYYALGGPGDWRATLATLLAERQQADGRFSNPYGAPNKEDDPLLATALAVTALTHALP